MAVTDQIHWSFQYDGRSQAPVFGERLIEIMQDTVIEDLVDDSAIVDRYLVLPNYWKGYRGRGLEEGDTQVEIGEVVVDRKQISSGNWKYDVRFLNQTSGEDLRLDFECLDNAFCTLTDSWNVSAVNGANSNDPVTCNWALFDVIPNMVDVMKISGDRISLTMLEDLEKVRENVRIGFMESFDLQVGNEVIPLDGFFNYGEGTLSSYWWLDQQGVVRIASTVFQTLVLISRKTGGGT